MQYVVLSALFISGCSGTEEKEEPVRPVFYQEVKNTSIQNTRSFPGVTQPQNEAKLSFKVGGTIEKLDVEMGDAVRKGGEIARLDDADYRINYNKAVVSLKNAQVQLATAKSSFSRIENLYAGNNVSLNEYEKAKAQFESAESMVKTAQAQVKAAQNQLDYTTLRAPYNGVISALLAKENEMTGPGQPIVLFSSADHMEVKTAVPENIIGQVKKGMEVTVRFSTFPEKSFLGKIVEVSPGNQNASAYPLIIRLTEPVAQMFPGMTVTVEIPLNSTHSEEAVIIISDAVGHDQNGDFVYVAEKSPEEGFYVVEKRSVTLGRLIPAGYEIKEGLNTEDIVITAGIRFLYEGRKVKLLDKNK